MQNLNRKEDIAGQTARIIRDKVKSNKMALRENYLSSVRRETEILNRLKKTLDSIFRVNPEYRIVIEENLTLSEYGRLTIVIDDPRIFSELQLNLMDKFEAPTKSKAIGNLINFNWEVPYGDNSWEYDTLTLRVSPEVNGCVLVEEIVKHPEETKTIPAWEETTYTVKCE